MTSPRRAIVYQRQIPRESGAFEAFLGRGDWTVLEPFVEAARPRHGLPELERALNRCRESRAALLVPELAPVARDRHFLDAVLAARVRLVAADARRTGRPTLELLRDVAARTHEDRSETSREALDRARRRGVRLGSPRPEVGSKVGVAALRARATAHAEEVAPWIAEIRLSNPDASLRELATALDSLGIPTARGGHWGPSAVRNVLRRMESPPGER